MAARNGYTLRDARCHPPHASRSHAPRGNGAFGRSAAMTPSGFTLLEVLLALFLTTVTLALLLFAMQVNAGVTDKSGREVMEAQLARALLQRIADDLRNAVPYQPPSGSSSSSSSSGGTAGTSAGTTSSSGSSGTGSSGTGSTSSFSGTASSSSSSNSASSTVPVSGGIFGQAQVLQVETSRRPRITRAMLANTEEGAPLSALSDLRIVTYSLNGVSGIGPNGPTTSGDPSGSLYRTDMDRHQFYMAQQEDGTESDAAQERLGDPEVGEIADLKFTYYDGTTANDQWDSNEEGKLPSSVRVTLSIRRPAKNSSSSLLGGLGAGSGERPLVVYDMLVDVPNSAVSASELQSLAQVDTMKSSSGSAAQ